MPGTKYLFMRKDELMVFKINTYSLINTAQMTRSIFFLFDLFGVV